LLPSGILRGHFRQLFNGLFDVLKRFVVEIAAQLVMESEVAVDPLRVGDVEKFGDKGLSPAGPIE